MGPGRDTELAITSSIRKASLGVPSDDLSDAKQAGKNGVEEELTKSAECHCAEQLSHSGSSSAL